LSARASEPALTRGGCSTWLAACDPKLLVRDEFAPMPLVGAVASSAEADVFGVGKSPPLLGAVGFADGLHCKIEAPAAASEARWDSDVRFAASTGMAQGPARLRRGSAERRLGIWDRGHDVRPRQPRTTRP